MTKLPYCILQAFVCCGFDIFAIAGHQFRSFVDFACLATLSLDWCTGLGATLIACSKATHSLRQACIAPDLCALPVRSEAAGTGLQSQLELFICSFRGLTKLSILLEGGDEYALSLPNILHAHGRTLQYFIRDLRKNHFKELPGSA